MNGAAARAWTIVAVTFCALGLTFASRSSVGVLIPTWEAELGWARAVSATGSSLVLVVMAVASPLAGNLIDRFGPRRVMAGGLAIAGAAILGTSTVSLEWQFLALFGLVGGIGYGAVSLPLVVTMMARIFDRHRGMATGIAISGSTAGQLPALTLLAFLVGAWGWRGAYLGFGLAILALVPAIWLLLGASGAPGGQPAAAPDRARISLDMPLAAKIGMLTRNRTFVLLFASFWLCGFTTAGVFDVHFVPYAVSCGFALVDGTAAHGVHGVGNMLGLILFGWLTDRVHRARLLAAMFAARALLFVVLLGVAGNIELLFFFALAFGILNFSTLPPIASLVASHIGVRVMGLTMGLLFGGHSMGAAIGAFFGGYMFDLMARYEWVWLISIALALLAAVFAGLIEEEPDGNQPRRGVAAPA